MPSVTPGIRPLCPVSAPLHRVRGQRPELQAAQQRVQRQQLQLHRAAVIARTPSRYNVKQHGGHGGQQVLLESPVRQVNR